MARTKSDLPLALPATAVAVVPLPVAPLGSTATPAAPTVPATPAAVSPAAAGGPTAQIIKASVDAKQVRREFGGCQVEAASQAARRRIGNDGHPDSWHSSSVLRRTSHTHRVRGVAASPLSGWFPSPRRLSASRRCRAASSR